jgi:hypothetical protein
MILFWVILTLALVGILAIMVYRRQKKPQRIMREGRLVKSETVSIDGEQLYVEKVAFKDWHVCIHSFYLISDKLAEGHTVVEQRWNYDDFCNITVRLEEYTYLLIRQVDVIALVRSFRPIPIDEFDAIAQPLI